MSLYLLYALVSVALLATCMYGLIVRTHLLRKILALNMMSSAVFLFLVAIAHRNRIGHPDPVPHAMVLTGIVVAVSTTAFALALTRRYHTETGANEFGDEDGPA